MIPREPDLPAAREDTRSEAELLAALEAMAPDDAAGVLAQMASALFPGGVGSTSQVTWDETAPSSLSHAASDVPEKLRAAELRYRTLVEQIPAVTFMAVLGEGSNEIYVSPHIESMLGFSQKEWLEDPFLWYWQLHPDDRALWVQEFARGCRTGGPFRAECRFLARDGRTVWVRGEARLVKDELGRPLFLQGVAFDATDSKRAEGLLLREAVRSTEERYRDLVEQIGAIFWEADAAVPGFTFVSRGAEHILGYTAEQWMADPHFWLSRVHPDDRDAARAARERARSDRRGTDEFEFRAFAADGRLVWLHQKLFIQRAENSERLLGVIIDITVRKQAEEILQQNEARLHAEANIRRTLHRIGSALASELDLERVVQLATDEATVLTTAEFGAFFCTVTNEAGESYTLYTLSGGSRDELAAFPLPENPHVFGPTFRGEGVVRVEDVTQDPRYSRNTPYFGMPAGHLPIRSYLAVPVISRSNTVLGGMFFGHSQAGVFTADHEQLAMGIAGWTAVALDNARLYQATESARAAAESANRAKDQFLATMSHELRTPLNAVLGWAGILKSEGLNEDLRRRAIETIEKNARAQAQIIDDLLDVSRIVSGKLHVELDPVDLVNVIDSALDSIRLAAHAKHISIEREVPGSGVAVLGDAARLQQVLTNLLTNAVKFTPEHAWVAVRLRTVRDQAEVRVEDSGKGIAPDFLPHVFEPFRQADGSTSRSHGGLGLGLAIVRHLVALHQGTVYAESAGLGQGATFTVRLPLMVAEEAAVLDRASGHWSNGDPRNTQALAGIHVLVVDDEEDSRDAIAYGLRSAGASVDTADSARGAMARLDSSAPDVLVSDIGMPGEDGYAFMRALRRRPGPLAAVPAIAVTAYASAEERARALAAGFNEHVRKPLNMTELIVHIEHLATARRR